MELDYNRADEVIYVGGRNVDSVWDYRTGRVIQWEPETNTYIILADNNDHMIRIDATTLEEIIYDNV